MLKRYTCREAGIDEEILTALCWNINKYSFDAAKNGKKGQLQLHDMETAKARLE